MSEVQNGIDDEIRPFVEHIPDFTTGIINALVQQPPSVLWHYTNFIGLQSILKTGHIYTTQITCLNDRREYRLLGDEVATAIANRLPNTKQSPARDLLQMAHEGLVKSDHASTGAFIGCFSGRQDDLGQWRGYGTGSVGYAIGFRTDDLFRAASQRRLTGLLPVCYASAVHRDVAEQICGILEGIGEKLGERLHSVGAPWMQRLAEITGALLDPLPAFMKDESFSAEDEWRIFTNLQPGDTKRLEFTQKPHVLARHLPFDLRGENGLLPISRVMVGPIEPARPTLVSVTDLLRKYDYVGVDAEASKAPYRPS